MKGSCRQYPPLVGMLCPLVFGVLTSSSVHVVHLPILHSHSCLEPLLYKSKKSVRGQRERAGGGGGGIEVTEVKQDEVGTH